MLNDYMSWAGGSDIGLHLPYIQERAKRAKVALELGVRSGCSTAALLAGLEESGGHLTSVDVLPPGPPAAFWEFPQWEFILGDDMTQQVMSATPDEVDLLMIDTSHRYSHTLMELVTYGPRVRTGGVILLHDTELEIAPGSTEEEDRGYPVMRAIKDWSRGKFLPVEWRAGCNGLGVIEVT